MIDNFDLIQSFLDFRPADTFYYGYILRRGTKDGNPNVNANNDLIRNYYIEKNDLVKERDKIIECCKNNNARFYLNINRRDKKRVALTMLSEIAKHMEHGDYDYVKKAYSSVCGTVNHESRKTQRWIIDYDFDETHTQEHLDKLIHEIHTQIMLDTDELGFLQQIKTKHGVHIITNPFNYTEIETLKNDKLLLPMKNSPTLVYCL